MYLKHAYQVSWQLIWLSGHATSFLREQGCWNHCRKSVGLTLGCPNFPLKPWVELLPLQFSKPFFKYSWFSVSERGSPTLPSSWGKDEFLFTPKLSPASFIPSSSLSIKILNFLIVDCLISQKDHLNELEPKFYIQSSKYKENPKA